MGQRVEYYLRIVDDMVGYDDVSWGHMIYPVLSNYPKLVEQSMEHVNVHYVDIYSLTDGL